VRRGWHDQRIVAVNSGANLNFDRLRHVAERADIGAEREALLAVEIPEQPGSFLKFCQALEQRNITEFNYRGQGGDRARILVGLGLTGGHDERIALVAQLRAAGYTVTDMSGNEIAKLHVRYLIGGKARDGADRGHDELLYRFEFPERPGALLRFLQAVGSRWNISLFHYRNHGSDHGRVLAGIEVPKAEREQFLLHLNELHYPYTDETANSAYRMFLGA
jgi:threonine dehydratase